MYEKLTACPTFTGVLPEFFLPFFGGMPPSCVSYAYDRPCGEKNKKCVHNKNGQVASLV